VPGWRSDGRLSNVAAGGLLMTAIAATETVADDIPVVISNLEEPTLFLRKTDDYQYMKSAGVIGRKLLKCAVT